MTDPIVGYPIDVWPNGALFEAQAQQPDVLDPGQPFSGKIVHVNEDGTVNLVYDDHHGARHLTKNLRIADPIDGHMIEDGTAWGSTKLGWRPRDEEGRDEPAAQLPVTTTTGQTGDGVRSTTSG